MKVLYSNMLPLGTQDNQETIDENIRKQMKQYLQGSDGIKIN